MQSNSDTLEQSPETPLLNAEERREEDNHNHLPQQQQQRRRHLVRLFLSPLTDETGSGWGVVAGLTTLFLVGTITGLALPHNHDLPTPWYSAVSSVIGYTYFSCWSVSFYPQVLSNFSRKSTQGLSADFCALNVLGFACYSVYNLSFFFSKTVQDMYKERHNGAEVTVQSNDVAFAVHAFVLSLVTLFQIGYYNESLCAMLPSRMIGGIMIGICAVILAYIGLVGLMQKSSWLDFLYMLSYIKIFVSLIKYIPQVVLNVRRKSTQGWSIWNILLDFTGGTLSDLQLVLDCADMHDWTGITGNLAKFGLGFVSIIFDVIFMCQHYVIYRDLNVEEHVDGNDANSEMHSRETDPILEHV